MRIKLEQAIELEDLIDVKSGEDYVHYQSVLKVLDVLNIQYSFEWTKKKPSLSINEESIFNKNEIKTYKRLSNDIENLLRDASSGYPIQESEALDILTGFKQFQNLIFEIT